jgi:hypothetical protein
VLDLGWLAGAFKTVFGGATAAKIAATAAVVTVATLPAGDTPQAARNEQAVAPTPVAQLPSGAPSTERTAVPTRSVAGSRADTKPKRRAAPTESRKTKPGAQSPAQPGPGQQAPATQPPGAPNAQETPLIAPPSVQVPPPPAVEIPPVQLPELPVQVPELPVELPTEVQLPQLPVQLPVQLPSEIQVPQLP